MQSVIELGIFLGWDGGELNLKKKKKKKKKYSVLCLFPFNLAFTCHLNCCIEAVFEESYSHLFYYYCHFR